MQSIRSTTNLLRDLEKAFEFLARDQKLFVIPDLFDITKGQGHAYTTISGTGVSRVWYW